MSKSSDRIGHGLWSRQGLAHGASVICARRLVAKITSRKSSALVFILIDFRQDPCTVSQQKPLREAKPFNLL